jgi:alpha-amylase/alpha-mannosidase (GH57 family)
MHQPSYRDLVTGACSMPWVRLHAAKDYVDMVERLEAFPKVRQTFNVVPSLVDQLEAYLPPSNGSDVFLDLSRKPASQLTPEDQRFLLQWFFMANLDHMIRPFPRYYDLLAKRGLHVREEEWPKVRQRFRTQDYLDLQVWFNLAWVDPWIRRRDSELGRLETKGEHFTEADKAHVLARHLELIGRVISTYRAAMERGQIELTTTPYYHPILPLLCDSQSARAGLPQAALPEPAFRHPEDARWQLTRALERHQAVFGAPARGVWPSEGSVSEETAALACEAGVSWLATDEEILWRTLKVSPSKEALYRPHRLDRSGGHTAIIFRDRELSDLIGFVYSRWEPRTAAADFLKRLDAIRARFEHAQRPPLVSVILDGENAWESYVDDGHAFFTALYAAFERDERFQCVTVSDYLAKHPVDRDPALPPLFSGSWIDGNFATWIGHPEKNAAWSLLAGARHALEGTDRSSAAWQSLGAAEGSDWMWWFGDTHFTAQADEFDRLFRAHVANAYRGAGLEPPESLSRPIRRPAAIPGFAPTGPVQPVIDGRESSYYEWLFAGRIDLSRQYGAIQRSGQTLRVLYHGFDRRHQYLRLDFQPGALAAGADWAVDISLQSIQVLIRPSGDSVTARAMGPGSQELATLSCAVGKVLEVAVPTSLLGLSAGEKLRVAVTLTQGGEVAERHPEHGTLELAASEADLEAEAWPI